MNKQIAILTILSLSTLCIHMLGKTLTITPESRSRLVELQKKEKFVENAFPMYPGPETPERGLHLNQQMTESISNIIKIIDTEPTKESVLGIIKRDLSKFSRLEADTEDREAICHYYDQVCGIVGISSTDGLLNNWLYGFETNK